MQFLPISYLHYWNTIPPCLNNCNLDTPAVIQNMHAKYNCLGLMLSSYSLSYVPFKGSLICIIYFAIQIFFFFLTFRNFQSWPSTFPSFFLPYWEFDLCLCWAHESSFCLLFTFKQIPLCMCIEIGEMPPGYPLKNLIHSSFFEFSLVIAFYHKITPRFSVFHCPFDFVQNSLNGFLFLGVNRQQKHQLEKLAFFPKSLMSSFANGKHSVLFLNLPSLPFLT